MANIRLGTLTKNSSIKTVSTAKDLASEETCTGVLYRDLKLDLTDFRTNGVYKNNSINSNINIKDIEVSENEAAVLNSVLNWFRTTKYTRLLNPELAIDFRQYLFEPVDEYTAYFIALDITKNLPYYEPRISIDLCKVIAHKDEAYFEIELKITIPSLNNKTINLKQILDSTGYTTI